MTAGTLAPSLVIHWAADPMYGWYSNVDGNTDTWGASIRTAPALPGETPANYASRVWGGRYEVGAAGPAAVVVGPDGDPYYVVTRRRGSRELERADRVRALEVWRHQAREVTAG